MMDNPFMAALLAAVLLLPLKISGWEGACSTVFHYQLSVLGITAGTMSMSCKEEGELLHLVMRADSTPLASKVYDLHDVIESWVDIATGETRRYRKLTREQGEVREVTAEVDRERGTYVWTKKGKQKTLRLPEGKVLDPLSLLYHLSFVDPHLEKEPVWVLTSKGPVLVSVVVKKRRIRVDDKLRRSLRIDIELGDSGLFSRKGKVRIWVKDGGGAMYRLKSWLAFGSLKASLIATTPAPKVVKSLLGTTEEKGQ